MDLRFIAIGELATGGVRWAEDYLTEDSSRKFEGPHTLARGVSLGSSTFQFGYDLVGGALK